MIRAALRTTAAVALLAVAYAAGLYGGYERTWPLPQLARLAKAQREPGVRVDATGRLLEYPGKQAMECPPQDKRTAVLLVFGQSNAANYQGQRHAAPDDRVVNFSGGRCYRAASPLLGADGQLGESWTLLGDKLVRLGLFSRVVLVPASVGGSSIRQWAAGGDLHRMLLAALRDLAPRYAVTAMLWDQGPTDYALGTSQDGYKEGFRSLLAAVRAQGVAAPVFVTRASLQLVPGWSPDNPIARAQAALVDGKSILAGPDTDRDVTSLDRFDGLHFSASGQEKFTDAWVGLLRAHAGGE